MDAQTLDNLARSLAIGTASRRSLVAGVGFASLTTYLGSADAKKKKKHCKKKKRCGKGCCNSSSCFAKAIDADAPVPEILSYGCCPASSFCKSELPNWQDQCCYPDETCDPQLPNKDPSTDSLCCRPCGGKCCQSSFECVNEVCTFANTARLPRYRR
jgi:hypothetical protein